MFYQNTAEVGFTHCFISVCSQICQGFPVIQGVAKDTSTFYSIIGSCSALFMVPEKRCLFVLCSKAGISGRIKMC